MARIVNQDFYELCRFISKYNLKEFLKDQNVKTQISAFHKKYYANLVIIEELRLSKDKEGALFRIDENQFSYLQESCSDLGQTLFLLFHGCYKGAKLLLRSSIENFLKGIAFDEDNTIITIKSVYEVFDKAYATSNFSGHNKKLHEQLHDIYAHLCQDVHTADAAHMASISALKHFPHYDPVEIENIFNSFKRLINVFITILAIKYNAFYHRIGFENKQVISDEILREYKKAIQHIM